MTALMSPSGAFIASAAQLACLLEASAAKPGNVSPGRSFPDLFYEDFLASAAAIGPAMSGAGSLRVGEMVRAAVVATGAWTRSNSNLGIVLLFAPLAQAAASVFGQPAADDDARHPAFRVAPARLRRELSRVLAATSLEDSRDVYAAIRAAAPGGLGTVDAEDVAGQPSLRLLEVMRLAAERDDIAREYVTDYERTFDRAVPALESGRAGGLSWNDAVVDTFLTLLAARCDTHIVRRAGRALAEETSALAAAALEAGGVRTASGRHTIQEMDRALRRDGHAANPGTTADLTAAALFVLLLSGEWRKTSVGTQSDRSRSSGE